MLMWLSSPMFCIFQQDSDIPPAQQGSVSLYPVHITAPGTPSPAGLCTGFCWASLPSASPFPHLLRQSSSSPPWAHRPSSQIGVVWKFIEGAFHPLPTPVTLNKVSLTPSPAEFPCNWWPSIFHPYYWSPEVQPIFDLLCSPHIIVEKLRRQSLYFIYS